jgi:hypothetical protein
MVLDSWLQLIPKEVSLAEVIINQICLLWIKYNACIVYFGIFVSIKILNNDKTYFNGSFAD